MKVCENNYINYTVMSHPPEGLFGKSVDYSTAHDSGKAKNGNVFNWEGETIQHQWDDKYIIKTKKTKKVLSKELSILEISISREILFIQPQP